MMNAQQTDSASETTELQHCPSMQFIPIRRNELVAALATDGLTSEQSRDFHTLCTFLGAYYHHDFYDELTELKDHFALFTQAGNMSPEKEVDARFAVMSDTFSGVLHRGNFIELGMADVERLGGDNPLLDVKTRTPLDLYESVRIFYRGLRRETFTQKTALSERKIPQEVFDDVVVFVRFRKDSKSNGRQKLLSRRTKLPEGVTPGSVLIKSFRNIARSELPMLLPDVQVVMSRKDALFLGGPALIGGIPIALNILPALSVVLVVIGAYLGFSGTVTQDKLMKAVGALSALIGAGAFMFRQYSNYSFRKLKYQKRLADNVYFKNVNNDTGVFDTLISTAEEQEVKEVILAYHSMLAKGPVANSTDLDRRVEAWLLQKFNVDIDFEVSDALDKLEGLGLLTQKDAKMTVCPLNDALSRLDMLWDRLYDFTSSSSSVPPATHTGANV
ncbi:MAG: TMEM143 family protein [Micropepsaceae bacterium]